MMIVRHDPIFYTDRVIELYSDKDGVPVTYVCTTELDPGNCVPTDVFYRESSHPEFGNRYFGLYHNYHGQIIITNADRVEELTFACVKNLEGGLQYSRDRHDCVTTDAGNMIDGGRLYTRTNVCEVFTCMVKDGRMVPLDETIEEMT